MRLQPISLEYISIFEPSQGVWHNQSVENPTPTDSGASDFDEEDFEAFCRRSLS